ncbi:glutamate--tRNA ligase family protein [Candidatus Vidania fulgoroideorum]
MNNTRFCPEPNGFLHIGHIKCILANIFFSKKKYLNLRIDDTNPDNSKKRYSINIIKDIKKITKLNKITSTSKYYKKLYNFNILLCIYNYCYFDKTNIDKFLENKNKYLFYNKDIKYNIYNIKKMKQGFFKEKQCFLRIIFNKLSKFPVSYRIKNKFHFLLKKKWNIFPNYDFANSICDIYENIKLSICTNEFSNNKKIYKYFIYFFIYIYKKNIEIPFQYEISKLTFKEISLSKRIINKKILKNNIKFNSRRLLTIKSLNKRNIPFTGIKKFIKTLGYSRKNSLIKFDMLRKFINNKLNKIIIKTIKIILNPIIFNNIIIDNKYNYFFNKKNFFILKKIIISNNFKYIFLYNKKYIKGFIIIYNFYKKIKISCFFKKQKIKNNLKIQIKKIGFFIIKIKNKNIIFNEIMRFKKVKI